MRGRQKPAGGLLRAARDLGRAALGELRALILLALVAAGALGFAEIAGEMREGDYRDIDRAVMLALRSPDDPARPIGPRWIEKVALDITALGSVTVLALLTLVVVGYLLLARDLRRAILVALAAGGGAVALTLLKMLFERPRPDIVPHLIEVTSPSFPSGHAMASATIYLTLGTLLAQAQERRPLRVYFPAVAVVATVLIGVTRVYLGVHWPSDVVAGWLAGATWAILCWLALDWLAPERPPVSDRPTR